MPLKSVKDLGVTMVVGMQALEDMEMALMEVQDTATVIITLVMAITVEGVDLVVETMVLVAISMGVEVGFLLIKVDLLPLNLMKLLQHPTEKQRKNKASTKANQMLQFNTWGRIASCMKTVRMIMASSVIRPPSATEILPLFASPEKIIQVKMILVNHFPLLALSIILP